MNEVKCKSFTLRTENGWLGQIIISNDGMFSSVTDYGNLSFAWRSFGKEDFREFLCGLSPDYFGGKMQNGLSYIAYSRTTQKACDRFAEKILPALQEALKEDLVTNKEWN